MDGDMLAKNVVVADAQPCRYAIVFQILRRVADDAAGVKLVARANRRESREINVRADDAICAQLHAFVNHGERSDLDRRIQLRLWMNDGGWVNHFHHR